MQIDEELYFEIIQTLMYCHLESLARNDKLSTSGYIEAIKLKSNGFDKPKQTMDKLIKIHLKEKEENEKSESKEDID